MAKINTIKLTWWHGLHGFANGRNKKGPESIRAYLRVFGVWNTSTGNVVFRFCFTACTPPRLLWGSLSLALGVLVVRAFLPRETEGRGSDAMSDHRGVSKGSLQLSVLSPA